MPGGSQKGHLQGDPSRTSRNDAFVSKASQVVPTCLGATMEFNGGRHLRCCENMHAAEDCMKISHQPGINPARRSMKPIGCLSDR